MTLAPAEGFVPGLPDPVPSALTHQVFDGVVYER